MAFYRSFLVRSAALALTGLIAGCSALNMDDGPVRATPHFRGDTFEIRHPSKSTIEGIDVSYFQEAVDWHAVARDDIRFAYIKATEGGDRLDERFNENFAGAARAGVLRGAYHFWYHCRPGIEQAAWFIRNVPRNDSALPPVLDIEWTPTSPTCTKRPPAADIHRDMQAFLDALEAHYGKRPMIYTSVDFYQDRLVGASSAIRCGCAPPPSSRGRPMATAPGTSGSIARPAASRASRATPTATSSTVRTPISGNSSPTVSSPRPWSRRGERSGGPARLTSRRAGLLSHDHDGDSAPFRPVLRAAEIAARGIICFFNRGLTSG